MENAAFLLAFLGRIPRPARDAMRRPGQRGVHLPANRASAGGTSRAPQCKRDTLIGQRSGIRATKARYPRQTVGQRPGGRGQHRMSGPIHLSVPRNCLPETGNGQRTHRTQQRGKRGRSQMGIGLLCQLANSRRGTGPCRGGCSTVLCGRRCLCRG